MEHFRECSRGEVAFFSICVLSLPVFAGSFFPRAVSFALFLLGFCILIYRFLKYDCFDFVGLERYLLWTVAGMVALCSFLLSDYSYPASRLYDFPVFLMSLSLALACTKQTDWFPVGIRVLIGMLFPFALATIVFWLDSSLYPPFKQAFFPSIYSAEGYQSGLTSHYSYNGTLMVTGFLVSVGALLFERKDDGHMNKKWLLCTVLFAFVVLLIGKRQNIIFSFVSVLVVIVLSPIRGKFFKAFISCTIAAIAVSFLIAYVPDIANSFERISATFESESIEESANGRLALWEYALSNWVEAPLLGHGWASFSYQFSSTTGVYAAHNELLDLLYKTGFIGASVITTCVFVTLATTCWLFWKTSRADGSEASAHVSYLAISLLLQLYFVAAGYSVGSLFGSLRVTVLYMFAVAISAAVWRRRSFFRALGQNN